jgi:hypothetical protein
LNPPTQKSTSEAPSPPSPAADLSPPPAPTQGGGKIARLPKDLRDNVNQWLLDGIAYAEIINRLGAAAAGIKPDNVGEWKKFGYKKWLLEKTFFDLVRERQQTPANLARDFDATEVNQGALQLATLHIFEALRDLNPGSLDEKLGGDCASFARLIHALARVSRETKELQKYREACAKARDLLLELKDPNRKLTEQETRAIVSHTCDILGVSSASKTPAHGIYAIKSDAE